MVFEKKTPREKKEKRVSDGNPGQIGGGEGKRRSPERQVREVGREREGVVSKKKKGEEEVEEEEEEEVAKEEEEKAPTQDQTRCCFFFSLNSESVCQVTLFHLFLCVRVFVWR